VWPWCSGPMAVASSASSSAVDAKRRLLTTRVTRVEAAADPRGECLLRGPTVTQRSSSQQLRLWAESAPTGATSGRTGVWAKAGIPVRLRNGAHRPKHASIGPQQTIAKGGKRAFSRGRIAEVYRSFAIWLVLALPATRIKGDHKPKGHSPRTEYASRTFPGVPPKAPRSEVGGLQRRGWARPLEAPRLSIHGSGKGFIRSHSQR
jgi:hypothetical protein